MSINSLAPSESYGIMELFVKIGSGNGLVPDGSKPLPVRPEPILTSHSITMALI